MLHTHIPFDSETSPMGGMIGAIAKARAGDPTARPLPRGFYDHQPVEAAFEKHPGCTNTALLAQAKEMPVFVKARERG